MGFLDLKHGHFKVICWLQLQVVWPCKFRQDSKDEVLLETLALTANQMASVKVSISYTSELTLTAFLTLTVGISCWLEMQENYINFISKMSAFTDKEKHVNPLRWTF